MTDVEALINQGRFVDVGQTKGLTTQKRRSLVVSICSCTSVRIVAILFAVGIYVDFVEEGMIKSKSYNVTLGFEEVAAVEDYQRKHGSMSFCNLVNGASFGASCDGVTINCVSERQSCALWDAVLLAMHGEDD